MRIEGDKIIDDDYFSGSPLEIDLTLFEGYEIDHDYDRPRVIIHEYCCTAYRYFDFYDEMKEWVKEFKGLLNGYMKTKGRR